MKPQAAARPKEPLPEETNRVSGQIVDAAYAVHSNLGPGLLENVYEQCLAHELTKRGLRLQRQLALPVIYDEIRLDAGLRIDMLVEDSVVVEIKAVEGVIPVHKAQVLTYLKLSDRRLGLLINFNVVRIKDGIQRIIL